MIDHDNTHALGHDGGGAGGRALASDPRLLFIGSHGAGDNDVNDGDGDDDVDLDLFAEGSLEALARLKVNQVSG